MEWQVSSEEKDRSDHRLRCISDRVEGPLFSPVNRRNIVMSRSSNCLELLAATQVVKLFAKRKSRISILLWIDNTKAVAYVNHLGGTVSSKLVHLTRRLLWMWCLEKNIHITAQCLPGSQNIIADTESRVAANRTDWKLNPAIFAQINHLFGPLEVDLFATWL